MKYSIKFHTNLNNNFWSIQWNVDKFTGSCRSTSRWCLQNYMENGWELTSELTSKWITFKNTQSNFTLISLITFEVINETPPNLQGSCRNTCWCACKITWKTGHHRLVLRQLPVNLSTFHWILQKLLLRLVWNLIEYFKSYSFRRQVRR